MSLATPAAASDRAAYLFTVFGTETCAGVSPLYAALADALVHDPELLALATGSAIHADPALFFTAVHFLLLENPRHPLGAYFPSVSTGPAPGADPYPLFRHFCLQREDMLRRLLATRRVTTADLGPCACLLPAFDAVFEEVQERPLALIQLGAGTALHLAWDRYAYEYELGRVVGNRRSPVRLTCAWRAAGEPPVSTTLPDVAYRLGVGDAPIDLTDPDEALWLRAGLWPEDREAATQIRGALRLLQDRPAPLLRGELVELLPDILDAAPMDAGLCIFHVATMQQWTRDEVDDLRELMEDHSIDRPVYRVSLEPESDECSGLVLLTYVNGREIPRTLARCDPHGRWIDWA